MKTPTDFGGGSKESSPVFTNMKSAPTGDGPIRAIRAIVNNIQQQRAAAPQPNPVVPPASATNQQDLFRRTSIMSLAAQRRNQTLGAP